jgi:hypothetical protein
MCVQAPVAAISEPPRLPVRTLARDAEFLRDLRDWTTVLDKTADE